MKIGILTLPLHTNYGGILQAYALQTVLERMGHEVLVVNKEKELQPLFKALLNLPYRMWKIFVCKKKMQLLPECYEKWVKPSVRRKTNSFIQKNIHVVHATDYASFFRESQVDAIVVGSDQVWRPLYVENIEDFFGGFDEENTKKKISYAASFGVDKWEFSEDQTLKCSRLLEKFDAVSVREETGVRLCREYFQVEALQVLDPTLLLNCSDYVKFITNKQPATVKGGLFGYILDASCVKRNVMGAVAKALRLTPYEVKSTKEASLKNYLKDKDNCVVPGVEDWLQAFENADVVVTDSFHGCVFSIIFHKPFWVLVNPERGAARFNSLLSMLNLEDRVVLAENISEKKWSQPIDWNAVDFLLDKKRCYSLNFLKENLNSQKA